MRPGGQGHDRPLHPFGLFFRNRQTELLFLGMKQSPGLKTIQATLSRQGIDHECLSSVDLKQRFPNIRFTKGEVGLLDKTGGVLYADKALRALQVRLCSPRATQLLSLGMLVLVRQP